MILMLALGLAGWTSSWLGLGGLVFLLARSSTSFLAGIPLLILKFGGNGSAWRFADQLLGRIDRFSSGGEHHLVLPGGGKDRRSG